MPPVFVAEHALHLRVRKVGGDLVAPFAEADEDFARLFVSSHLIGVAQAGESFVDVYTRETHLPLSALMFPPLTPAK